MSINIKLHSTRELGRLPFKGDSTQSNQFGMQLRTDSSLQPTRHKLGGDSAFSSSIFRNDINSSTENSSSIFRNDINSSTKNFSPSNNYSICGNDINSSQKTDYNDEKKQTELSAIISSQLGQLNMSQPSRPQLGSDSTPPTICINKFFFRQSDDREQFHLSILCNNNWIMTLSNYCDLFVCSRCLWPLGYFHSNFFNILSLPPMNFGKSSCFCFFSSSENNSMEVLNFTPFNGKPIRVNRDPTTPKSGLSKGYVFVQYDSHEAAQRIHAICNLRGLIFRRDFRVQFPLQLFSSKQTMSSSGLSRDKLDSIYSMFRAATVNSNDTSTEGQSCSIAKSGMLDNNGSSITVEPGNNGRLFEGEPGDRTVKAFTDADWAGSIDDRKSTSGYYTFVWVYLVTWRSKKQNVVARSSAEAEFRSMAHGVCDSIWIKSVCEELNIQYEGSIQLHCDNQSAIRIAHNPVQHDRTKHVEIDRHFIKEKIEEKIINVQYINTTQQIADILTKGLAEKKKKTSTTC